MNHNPSLSFEVGTMGGGIFECWIRSPLASLCINRSNTISGSELKEKIGEEDAKLLMTTVEDALSWLEDQGEAASTEDIQSKQQVRECLTSIIICLSRSKFCVCDAVVRKRALFRMLRTLPTRS